MDSIKRKDLIKGQAMDKKTSMSNVPEKTEKLSNSDKKGNTEQAAQIKEISLTTAQSSAYKAPKVIRLPCKYFYERGGCSKGSSCQYSHDLQSCFVPGPMIQQLPPPPPPQISCFYPWYPPRPQPPRQPPKAQQKHDQGAKGSENTALTPEDAVRLADAAIKNLPRPGVVPAAWSYTQMINESDGPDLYAKANRIQRLAAEQFRRVNGWLPKELMYRTKLCSFYYYTGYCQKGDRCNFSHEVLPGMEEPPPPPETKIMSMKYLDPDGEKSEFYRTKPCKFFFERGVCLKGDLCNYSHDPELYEEYMKEQEYYSDDDDDDEYEEDDDYDNDDDKEDGRDKEGHKEEKGGNKKGDVVDEKKSSEDNESKQKANSGNEQSSSKEEKSK